MVKGRIWGKLDGKYREIEIEECDAIVAIGIKDKDDKIGLQSSALGSGLTAEDFVVSVADAVVHVVSNRGESPKEKRDLVCLLADEVNRMAKEPRQRIEEMLEKLERFLNESGIHEL